MARIRTIKPEFFTSEDIVALSPLARLLYVAIWIEADREGRLVWKPRTFKMRYFPADDCDISALCDELIGMKLVVLYGEGFAYVPKFAQHQHINPRETASSLPDPHASRTRQHASRTVSDAQGGKEGKGKSSDASADADLHTPSAPPPVASIPLVDGSEFEVLPSKAAEWSAAFPAVDVEQQLKAMRAWCNANPSRRKTRRGVEAFAVTWLTKAQDSGRGPRGQKTEDAFAGAL